MQNNHGQQNIHDSQHDVSECRCDWVWGVEIYKQRNMWESTTDIIVENHKSNSNDNSNNNDNNNSINNKN